MLLLTVTAAVAKAEQYSCGQENPFGYGACAGDNSCVNSLLTYLENKTPYAVGYVLTASNPDAESSGRYTGDASCSNKYTEADCQSCLSGAGNWLTNNCVKKSLSSGYYSYGFCNMAFKQMP
ncbi:hypothetical protein LINGRAHAP2_LOCUS34008 [Linum grandiflorum]